MKPHIPVTLTLAFYLEYSLEEIHEWIETIQQETECLLNAPQFLYYRVKDTAFPLPACPNRHSPPVIESKKSTAQKRRELREAWATKVMMDDKFLNEVLDVFSNYCTAERIEKEWKDEPLIHDDPTRIPDDSFGNGY